MFGLPFREVWVLDFEFIAEPGTLPVPVCLVARELRSGRLLRLWQDELVPGHPPFPVDDQALFVASYASAEVGCFLALGWPVPARLLDLYAEFRNETNGLALPGSSSLLGALAYHHIPSITSDQKNEERALIMRGGPWTDAERRRILDYCQTDVDVLGPLLERMTGHIRATPTGLGQGLLRGRYMAAAARIERAGVPVDTETLARLRDGWESIKLDLVRAVDEDFGVYDGTSFKAGLFAAYLADRGIAWPRLDSGQLQLDQDTFRDMSKRYPQLEPLKELRHSLGQLRLADLAVGPDGRNRVLLSPFRAATGRNQPSNSRFIFGPATWIRGLIKPAEGRAVAYIDWSAQEVWIAAKLSGDLALLDSVTSGDPYLAFAKRAGLAPAEATKASHKAVRDVCKTCLLGANYGMQARSLAYRTGVSEIEAQEILRRLASTYPVYAEWAQQVVDAGQLGGRLTTVLGWQLHVGPKARATSLRNFPMQANGAEMLRLACCLATEAGITVCAPVHDALLIEAPTGGIDAAVAATRAAMAQASALVLNGLEVGTDADVVRWPDRYADPRGAVMWSRVTELLESLQVSGS
jgi:DNA polymerase family A